ncbi:Asp-tRNA(Asn)/Glu-tRNA(Gln) amidotransferase subunit GatA [Conexibacter sp. W3-3-2]|uniref:Asp-tRNA(Asn)/Glu-tRNA(Gln) amidotransferase subunit GatA n=1 Tax=Conexibacter sp. W3-3-2 TaxID=2675227 RepID=UPI0012BA04B9|nr:Asp-tRNA(Asn)/Glu-tRNA(Gln) amidotransferase subunit GatA [Conexibacter sp. W3-3-2]MTD43383.1 Asp-tRNA(Asn)/Glu-tRNA(Gln) amidotransferase subunit GatA [Conexibacter sp. W3-3-2]
MSDILDLSAAQAIAAIDAGELDPADLFEAYRAASAAEDLGALSWVADAAPADLAALREQSLRGLPLAVKDLFCTEGVPSQAGSKILEGYLPPYTATVVQRLQDAGSSLLSKTHQDEFAMGSSTENCAFGPTRNPWDTSRVPGGSSGGSSAAVAAGLAPWALGTDTGGSIRQPAALCGIVGLKPTYGACSRFGMIAFASSLDQAGPFARDVTDTALLYAHMHGRDPRDATSVGLPEATVLPTAQRLDGITLGVPKDVERDGIEPGVRAAFDAALQTARDLGAEIREVELPHAEYGIAAYYVLAPAEASSNLARFDGVRYGLRTEAPDLLSMYTRTRHDGFGPEVKRRILIGTYALSSGYYDAYYASAQKVRTLIRRDLDAAFADVDLIVTPTTPGVAFPLGSKTDDPLSMYLEDYFTVPFSLAGVPAISIPCGLSEGLPVGLQLAGPAFSENRILDAAFALEGALGFDGSVARKGGAA